MNPVKPTAKNFLEDSLRFEVTSDDSKNQDTNLATNWTTLRNMTQELGELAADPIEVKNRNTKELLFIMATKLAPKLPDAQVFEGRTARKIFVLTSNENIPEINKSMIRVIHIDKSELNEAYEAEATIPDTRIIFLASPIYTAVSSDFGAAVTQVSIGEIGTSKWEGELDLRIADHSLGANPAISPIDQKYAFPSKYFTLVPASFSEVADGEVTRLKNRKLSEIVDAIVNAYKNLKAGVPPVITYLSYDNSSIGPADIVTPITDEVLCETTGKHGRIKAKAQGTINKDFSALVGEPDFPAFIDVDLTDLKTTCISHLNSFADVYNTVFTFNGEDSDRSIRSAIRKMTGDGPSRKASYQFSQVIKYVYQHLEEAQKFFVEKNIDVSNFGKLMLGTPFGGLCYLAMSTMHVARDYTGFRITDVGPFKQLKMYKDLYRGGLVFSEAENVNLSGFMTFGNADALNPSNAIRFTGIALMIQSGLFSTYMLYAPNGDIKQIAYCMGLIFRSTSRYHKLKSALTRNGVLTLNQTTQEQIRAQVHESIYTETRMEPNEKMVYLSVLRFGLFTKNTNLISPFYDAAIASMKLEKEERTAESAKEFGLDVDANLRTLGIDNLALGKSNLNQNMISNPVPRTTPNNPQQAAGPGRPSTTGDSGTPFVF